MSDKDRSILLQAFAGLDLSEEEQDALWACFRAQDLEAGGLVIEAGDASDHLIVLLEGELEVLGMHDGKRFLLCELRAPEIIGELAFLDPDRRATSVRAKTAARAMVLDRETLGVLARQHPKLDHRLLSHLGRVAIRRLRASNDQVVEEMNLRNKFGRFVILLIVGFSLITLLTGLIEEIRQSTPFYVISLVASLGVAVLSYLSIRTIGEPLRNFGVNASGWRRQLLESAVIGAVGFGLCCLVVSPGVLIGQLAEQFLGGFMFIYFMVASVQEFICRGVLQTALEKFLDDTRGVQSILVAALTFSVTHAMYGAMLTGLTFVMGILFGFLYRRHRSLIGVTLVHFVLGTLAGELGLVH